METTRPRRRLVGWVVLAAIVVLLVTGGSLLWRWRTHPTAFDPAGGWGVGLRDFQVGQTLYVGMSVDAEDSHGTVTLDDLSPSTVRDTSGTTVEFFVCVVDTSEGIGAIGTVADDRIAEDCTSLVPAEGAQLTLGARPPQQLLVALSPQRPGRITLDGIEVTYSHGRQHGTQLLGGTVDLRTSPTA